MYWSIFVQDTSVVNMFRIILLPQSDLIDAEGGMHIHVLSQWARQFFKTGDSSYFLYS
jgi:hypothetical protein